MLFEPVLLWGSESWNVNEHIGDNLEAVRSECVVSESNIKLLNVSFA